MIILNMRCFCIYLFNLLLRIDIVLFDERKKVTCTSLYSKCARKNKKRVLKFHHEQRQITRDSTVAVQEDNGFYPSFIF
jgi:hypothetical protein